jgi:hypothetical protein
MKSELNREAPLLAENIIANLPANARPALIRLDDPKRLNALLGITTLRVAAKRLGRCPSG